MFLCYAVPQENWRTPFWVDLCQEAGTALHKLRRDQVTCCPLPVPVPLAGMETVRCVLPALQLLVRRHKEATVNGSL